MKIKQVKETCLYIQDLNKIQDFYQRKLGLPVISRVENRHIFFRAGSSVLLCFIPETTKNETSLPPHFAYGKQHIAFEVAEEDYQSWLDKLKKENIEIIHQQPWKNNLTSCYFHDPEGHVLEIVPEGIWE
ncbi:glyoxalase/bleomycin resistance/extradiol dioxygenase family protein [soil metagenome]